MHALFVDDRSDARQRIASLLGDVVHRTRVVDVPPKEGRLPSLILVGPDHRQETLGLLRERRATGSALAGLLVAVLPDETPATVLEAIECGADDFVVESWSDDALRMRLGVLARHAGVVRTRAPLPIMNAFHDLTEAGAVTGERFFQYVTERVARLLGVDWAFVGEIAAGSNRVRVRAVRNRGEVAENFTYPLEGAPCAEVLLRGGVCLYERGVREQFPDDEDLVTLNAESYAACALRGADGSAIGLIAVIDSAPIETPEAVESVLGIFAARASAELERVRAHAALERRGRAISALYSLAATRFESLQKRVEATLAVGCELFEMPTGLLMRVDGDQIEVVAAHGAPPYISVGERVARNESLCERALASNAPVAIARAHMDSNAVGLRSYLGSAVLQNGARTGTICFCSREPREGEFSETDREVISLMARFIGAELERQHEAEQRLALEAQMQHSQKLESLGLMAGGIAHDFNNLLTGILGNASLALRRLPSDSGARDFVTRIEVAGRRAADLTQQMLAYSGRSPIDFGPVSLSRLVLETAQLLRTVVPRNARLEIRCSDGAPPARGDASQLRQVVMNLLTNAGDAIGAHEGTIRVTTGVRDADAAFLAACEGSDRLVPGAYAFLEVADDGAGIGPEDRARMFDPFFSTKESGRGLGLAAVIGIVRGHAGGIHVESAPGRGTRICLLIPPANGHGHGQAVRDDAAPSAVAGQDEGTVLVVDDEETARSVACAVLEEFGFTPLPAADGTEALALHEREGENIRLVLLDMTMPGLSGMETLERLRARNPDLPVVLCSGYNEPEEGPAIDAVFLQKPYDTGELLAAARAALARA